MPKLFFLIKILVNMFIRGLQFWYFMFYFPALVFNNTDVRYFYIMCALGICCEKPKNRFY